jgi:hypothetical protein
LKEPGHGRRAGESENEDRGQVINRAGSELLSVAGGLDHTVGISRKRSRFAKSRTFVLNAATGMMPRMRPFSMTSSILWSAAV